MNSYNLSIVVCLYNSENHIENLFNNLNKLNKSKIQIILVDDGSTDLTFSKISNLELSDNMKIIYQKNMGLAGARNTGVNSCTSQWIALLDHDDKLTNEKIDFCNNFDEKINELNHYMYFANAFIVNKFKEKNLKFYKDYFLLNHINLNKKDAYNNLLLKGCFIVSSTFFFNIDVFKKINGFDEKLYFTCDYDFFLRATKLFDISYIDQPHCEWIEHENQSTKNLKYIHYKELVLLYSRELKKFNNFNSKLLLIYVKLIRYRIKLFFLFFVNYGNRFKI